MGDCEVAPTEAFLETKCHRGFVIHVVHKDNQILEEVPWTIQQSPLLVSHGGKIQRNEKRLSPTISIGI